VDKSKCFSKTVTVCHHYPQHDLSSVSEYIRHIVVCSCKKTRSSSRRYS